ncbi:MAG: hypothetical protein ACRECF_00735 [Methyloceanibacter sp.]
MHHRIMTWGVAALIALCGAYLIAPATADIVTQGKIYLDADKQTYIGWDGSSITIVEDGVETVNAADLDLLDDITASAAEINVLDGVLATTAELNRAADVSTRVVNVTAATLVVAEATHEGKVVTLNAAGGIDVTMPAATGSGAKYHFIVGTATTDAYAFAMTGNDTMSGIALMEEDDVGTANSWPCAGCTSITLGGTAQATGGSVGDQVTMIDGAADKWYIHVTGTQGGTDVTPFAGP